MSQKSFMKGAFFLTCAGFLSRLLGFFYRLFLSHTIGAHGLGLYQLCLPLQGFISAITIVGMQSAISRICASFFAKKDKEGAWETFLIGTAASCFITCILSYFLYKNASFLSLYCIREESTAPLIRILSFSFPFSALHACVNAYYFSQQKTLFPSVLQFLEQIVRVGSSYIIYIILVSEGKEITASITATSTFLSEFFAAFLSIFAVFFCKKLSLKIPFSPAIIKKLLSVAVPLSFNKFLVTFLNSIELIAIPQMLIKSGLSSGKALEIYGIFTGMAIPLILFPSTITHALSTMLLPSVSRLHTLNNKQEISSIIRRSIFLGFSLGSFCTLFFYASGPFLGRLLFQNNTAGLYIKTLSFVCPFLYMNIILGSIINGLEKTAAFLLHNIIGISLRIFFVMAFIPQLGITGYLYGLLSSELIVTILHIYTLISFDNPK